MSRGSNEFTTMKGFMDGFTIKEGQVPETLPPEATGDVTEGAEVDDAKINAPKAANIKPSENKTGDPSTTMSKEVEEVADKAEEDVADGYVADIQELPGPGTREEKGYERYDRMVNSGIVVKQPDMNHFNVKHALREIVDNAELKAAPEVQRNSGWLEGDFTVSKGLTFAEMKGIGLVGKAPEDEGGDDGYTEDNVGETIDQESDDKEETQGENKTNGEQKPKEDSFSEEGAEEEKGMISSAIQGVKRAYRGGGARTAASKAGSYGKAYGKRALKHGKEQIGAVKGRAKKIQGQAKREWESARGEGAGRLAAGAATAKEVARKNPALAGGIGGAALGAGGTYALTRKKKRTE